MIVISNTKPPVVVSIDGRDPQELSKDELLFHLADTGLSGYRLCDAIEASDRRIAKLEALVVELGGVKPELTCSDCG